MRHKDWREPEIGIEDEISSYSSAWGEIPSRVGDLQKEADIETLLLAAGALLSLVGLGFGAKRKRWLFLPAGVAALMLQQAVRKDSAIVAFLRRWGFRTRREIAQEIFNLKKSEWGVGELSAASDELERAAEESTNLEPPPL